MRPSMQPAESSLGPRWRMLPQREVDGVHPAQAAVDSTVAQQRITQQALDDTVIRAPISGMVAKRYVQRGDKAAVALLGMMDRSGVQHC